MRLTECPSIVRAHDQAHTHNKHTHAHTTSLIQFGLDVGIYLLTANVRVSHSLILI